jgi:cystathionine beta-lyase/cystathionine gamma-synthase
MMPENKHPAELRPETNVLTRGFDPTLSVGSARPAVFRSSTYVFSSPEAAERAFDVMGGRGQLEPGESTDLVYSRFNHPNAEIVEDQILPLEPGAVASAVFNSGMAAIMTTLLAVLKPGHTLIYTVPISSIPSPYMVERKPSSATSLNRSASMAFPCLRAKRS